MRPSQETLDFLELMTRNGPEIGAGLPAAELRAALREGRTPPSGPEIALVRAAEAPGPAGPVPLRHYHPEPGAVLPGVVFFHGGGFVIGDLDSHDHVCRIIAAGTGASVVSVGYRLAPEHPFPAPVDDAFAALRWIAANAGEFGIDPGRLAVAGDSAGGCLAAVTAQLARDAGGPGLAFQALVYPVVDWTADETGERYPSYRENGQDYFLTSGAMGWFADQYLSSPSDAEDPRCSPLLAGSLAGLPPALVLTADFDPLRDEGEAYARALAAAGVPATTVRINDGFHGILGFGAFLGAARRAEAAVNAALRHAFAAAG
ncbi:alpha/beta hydrolase [Nocardiopsis sp. CNT-189]|uniref:alpha/beta hydrolase n=1 Tax=Nocardiopsis oceanisediminis TaxID=2816862 RepID=UPI003B34E760